jgi:hypothetical protein
MRDEERDREANACEGRNPDHHARSDICRKPTDPRPSPCPDGGTDAKGLPYDKSKKNAESERASNGTASVKMPRAKAMSVATGMPQPTTSYRK